MDVYETITSLLAVRSYQDKAIPADSVGRILEAGRLSASSMNGQPWRFIVVENRDTLRQLGHEMKYAPYVKDAALAIAVAIEHTPYAVSDASRAIQNMVLAAWAEGIGSNWAGFNEADNVKKVLSIPAEFDLLAVVPFGYPADAPAKGAVTKKRKAPSEVSFRESFGKPLG